MDLEAAFKKVINGTAVITCAVDGTVNGMTAAWVTRVSHVPPLVLVSVGLSRYTHELIPKAGSFCVNLVSEDQLSLAKNFGFTSGRTSKKFEGMEYKLGKTGSPVIEGVAGYLDCKLTDSLKAGDHTIFIGEVIDCGASDKKHLVVNMEDYR